MPRTCKSARISHSIEAIARQRRGIWPRQSRYGPMMLRFLLHTKPLPIRISLHLGMRWQPWRKGWRAVFLQSSAAGIVQKLVRSTSTMVEFDRSEVEEFLQSSHASDYSPQSSSITGILKQLKDTMSNNLA